MFPKSPKFESERWRIECQYAGGATYVGRSDDVKHTSDLLHEPYNGDPYAATRRAIVRAAAAIGASK